MTNKQHFSLKMSLIIKEKNDRIKVIMLGQEALDIFSKAEKKQLEEITEEKLIDNLNSHLLDYARDPSNEKDLIDDLTLMFDLILD